MAVVFDQAIISQVQQANDIVDVIAEHVSLARKGKEMVGLCPFHDDHRPSLNVSPAKQIFKCFACGAGGDVFKFVQLRESLTFPQAIERLAERAGIKIKPEKPEKGKRRVSTDVDPNRLAKVNAWAAGHFQRNLHDEKKGKFARQYIVERKISPESAKKWQLGLAAASGDDLIKAARAENIPPKLLEQAGLLAGPYQDRFINRLMFVITDVTGRIIGFGGRSLDETGAKYINSPATVLFDKSNSLYGLQHARHQIAATQTAVVVEGYTDCIMAHQFGCSNVVAALGTSFTTGQGRILRRYAKKVVLIFDSDAAGTEAANRALDVCLSLRLDIKLASMPQAKDPCDFLLAKGKEAFEQLVHGAVDVFQFKWDRLTERFGSDASFAGRRQAIEEYLQTIATSMQAGNLSPIDLGLRVNQISKIIGLDSKQINKELNSRRRQAEKTASYGVENKKLQSIDYGQGLAAAAQRELLEVLLNKPALYQTVRQKITLDDFDVPVLNQTAAILFEALNTEPEPLLTRLLAKTESIDVARCLIELQQVGQEKGNFESRLTDAIDVLQRNQVQKRRNQFKTEQDQAKYLRYLAESTDKENRHNVGMT